LNRNSRQDCFANVHRHPNADQSLPTGPPFGWLQSPVTLSLRSQDGELFQKRVQLAIRETPRLKSTGYNSFAGSWWIPLLFALHTFGSRRSATRSRGTENMFRGWVPDCAIKQPVWGSGMTEQFDVQDCLFEDNLLIPPPLACAELWHNLFQESGVTSISRCLGENTIKARVTTRDEWTCVADNCMVAVWVKRLTTYRVLILGLRMHASATPWHQWHPKPEA
jgi:hypothetical protein